MSRARRRIGALSLLLLLAGMIVITGRAAAALSGGEEVGKLAVTYEPNPALWTDVQPGDTLGWWLRVSLTGARAADLALQLSGQGPLLDQNLAITIEQCPLAPADTACAESRTPVVTMLLADVAGAQRWQLEPLDLAQDVALLVRLHVPEAAQVPGERTKVGIGLMAVGDSPFERESSTDPEPTQPTREPTLPNESTDDPLAYTGLDLLGSILLALGLIGFGSLSWISARQRRQK